MSKYSDIWISGSVGYDHIMNMPGRFRDFIMPDKIHMLNVSFTVDTFRQEFGGTGANAAYTMGLLGLRPKLVSTFGKDAEDHKSFLEEYADLGGSQTRDELAARGYVMTDRDDNQIWSYFPGAMKYDSELTLSDKVKIGDLVALLPSNPQSFTKYLTEVTELGVDYMFDPAFFIPNLTDEELVSGLAKAKYVMGNDYEIALMEKRTSSTVKDWVAKGVVVVKTLGPNGVEMYVERQRYQIPAVQKVEVIDPTGAGDALRAGFLAGLMEGKMVQTCAKMGVVSAAYAIEVYGTQRHKFSREEFEARYVENFGPMD